MILVTMNGSVHGVLVDDVVGIDECDRTSNIRGVTQHMANLLAEQGMATIQQVALASPAEIALACSISTARAARIIEYALAMH